MFQAKKNNCKKVKKLISSIDKENDRFGKWIEFSVCNHRTCELNEHLPWIADFSYRNQHCWTHWKLINCRLSADVHFHGKKKHTKSVMNNWKSRKTFNRKSLCLHLFIHKSTRQKKNPPLIPWQKDLFFCCCCCWHLFRFFFLLLISS